MRGNAFLFCTILLAPIAGFAQNQRSAVSINGLDANPCTPALPCRSFATAISHTLAGGEVIAQDSAGFGPFVLTAAMTIEGAPGVYAGVTSNNGVGISVNVPFASSPVILKGLTINITGVLAPADTAIDFVGGGSLDVYGCTINRAYIGIKATVAGSELAVDDTVITNVSSGIWLAPLPGSSPLKAVADNVRVTSFSFLGFVANGNSRLTATHCVAANGYIGFASQNGTLTGAAELYIEWSAAINNTFGVYVSNTTSNGPTYAFVSNCVLTNNISNGLLKQGDTSAILYSRMNNTVQGNDGGPSQGTITPFSGN